MYIYICINIYKYIYIYIYTHIYINTHTHNVQDIIDWQSLAPCTEWRDHTWLVSICQFLRLANPNCCPSATHFGRLNILKSKCVAWIRSLLSQTSTLARNTSQFLLLKSHTKSIFLMVQFSCLKVQFPFLPFQSHFCRWNRWNPHVSWWFTSPLTVKKNQLVVRRLQQLVFAHRHPLGSSLDAASTIGWSVDACQEARMVDNPTCWVKDGAQDGLTGLTIRWLKFPMFPWSNHVKSNFFDGKSSQCFHGKSFFF